MGVYASPEEIKLSDEEGEELSTIQVLRTIKATHGLFGDFDITEKTLNEFVKNFKARTRGTDIPVNYSHMSGGKAAGWMEKVYVKDGKLFADVKFTPQARQAIKDKEFMYISAEFNEDYKDPESGKKKGAVLLGAALTNIPFVRGMDKVLSDIQDFDLDDFNQFKQFMEQKEKDSIMNFEDFIKQLSDATPEQKKQIAESIGASFDKGNNGDDKALSDAQAQIKELQDKNTALEKAAEFNELVSKGKAVESQREHYLNGDMAAFAEAAVKVNLDAAGTGDNPSGDDKEGKTKTEGKELSADTREEAEDKILELAVAKQEKNKSLALSDAIAEVRYEHPKLASKTI